MDYDKVGYRDISKLRRYELESCIYRWMYTEQSNFTIILSPNVRYSRGERIFYYFKSDPISNMSKA